jgi:DNA-binding transcriptional ArsR family regulator
MNPMSSDKGTSDLAGALQAARREIEGVEAEVRDALHEAHQQVAGAREHVALLQEVVRTITDVDTIKALADPTRLAILRALSRDRMPKSAKELAEDLDQPQTKLYRHLKVLQEAGLIEAAETRVVSGIVETKYRAAQSSVKIDPSEHPDETAEAMVQLIGGNLADYRERFLWNAQERLRSSDPVELENEGAVMNLSAVIAPELAEEFQRRVEELTRDFDNYPRDPDGVRIEGLISWFRPGPGPSRRPGPGSA